VQVLYTLQVLLLLIFPYLHSTLSAKYSFFQEYIVKDEETTFFLNHIHTIFLSYPTSNQTLPKILQSTGRSMNHRMIVALETEHNRVMNESNKSLKKWPYWRGCCG